MIDVSINGDSLYAVYGLALTNKEIGTAEAETSTIKVPGRSGRIDVTDFIGVSYDNRTIKMSFRVTDYNCYSGTRASLEEMNGTKVKAIFSDEPNIYWSGRLTIADWTRYNRLVSEVELELDADPFPYDVTEA